MHVGAAGRTHSRRHVSFTPSTSIVLSSRVTGVGGGSTGRLEAISVADALGVALVVVAGTGGVSF
jgi:hypothetical protein